jgi:putative NADH-flavin reductase
VARDPEGFERIDSAVRVTKGAATGSASVATGARGADAFVGAVDPPKNGQSDDDLAQAAHGLIGGAHRAGVRRLLVLCDAGRIEVASGIQAADTPDLPEARQGNAPVQREVLDVYRSPKAADLDWTHISSAALDAPGLRSGRHRVGFEQIMLRLMAKATSRLRAAPLRCLMSPRRAVLQAN